MEPWSKSSKEAHPGFSVKSRPSDGSDPHFNNENQQISQEYDDPSIISISNFEKSNRHRHFEH